VSSDKQDTARQVKRIEGRGLPIGFCSGRNREESTRLGPQREAFQAMLKAVEAGLIGRIIVDRQDRFAVKDGTSGQVHRLYATTGQPWKTPMGGFFVATMMFDSHGNPWGNHVNPRAKREGPSEHNGQGEQGAEGEYQGGYPPYGLMWFASGRWEREVAHRVRRSVQAFQGLPERKREALTAKTTAPEKTRPTSYSSADNQKDRIKVAGQIFDWYSTEDLSPADCNRLNELGVDSIYAAIGTR